MNFFQAVFALGTAWFFIISFAWVILLFIFVENEKTVSSGLSTFFYLFFLQVFVQVNILKFALENPIKAFLILGVYFLLGFFWSFIKWGVFVNKIAIIYKENRLAFLKDKINSDRHLLRLPDLGTIDLNTAIPEELMVDWKRQRNISPRPLLHENKNRVSHWVIYWPVSLIWSILNDFIKKLVNIVVIRIRSLYELITKNAYRSISDQELK